MNSLPRCFQILLVSILLSTRAGAYEPSWCGQENEQACGIFTADFWQNGGLLGCDRGLSYDDGICVNDSRREAVIEWPTRALRLQEQLSAHEPFNLASILGVHNAFNNYADGYFLVPNQDYSISDALRLGARAISIDIHWFNGSLRLCHAPPHHFGCSLTDRLYYNVIREINYWLRQPENAREVIIIDIEDRSDGHYAELISSLQSILGDLIFHANKLKKFPWPSRTQLVAAGKRVVVIGGENMHDGTLFSSAYYWPGYPNGNSATFQKNWPLCSFKYDHSENTLPPNRFSEISEDRAWNTTPHIEKDTLIAAARCNLSTIWLDFLTTKKIADLIWSWAPNQPNIAQGRTCTFIDTGKRRWYTDKCTVARRFACRHTLNKNLWRITSHAGPFNQGPQSCQIEHPQFQFAVPATGYSNEFLITTMTDQEIWVNAQVSNTSSGNYQATNLEFGNARHSIKTLGQS